MERYVDHFDQIDAKAVGNDNASPTHWADAAGIERQRKQSKPEAESKREPANRHERRKAAALARRRSVA